MNTFVIDTLLRAVVVKHPVEFELPVSSQNDLALIDCPNARLLSISNFFSDERTDSYGNLDPTVWLTFLHI